MTRPHVAGVAGVLAALAVAGCTDSKSFLHVSVTGDVQGLFQLVVDISVGDQASQLVVPSSPRAITLPTSFNVEMERSRQGRLIVDIQAKDENAVTIATGSRELEMINVGNLNTMSVELLPFMPPGGEPDGGGQPDGGGEADADDAGVPADDAGDDDASGAEAGP